MQVGAACPSRITYSLGSQLINNSLSRPSAGAGGNGLNFPGFFHLQPAPGSIPSPEQQQVLCSQLEKIHTLFRRQLGIPLLGKGCSAGAQGLQQLGEAPGIRNLLAQPHQVQLEVLCSLGRGADPSGAGMF